MLKAAAPHRFDFGNLVVDLCNGHLADRNNDMIVVASNGVGALNEIKSRKDEALIRRFFFWLVPSKRRLNGATNAISGAGCVKVRIVAFCWSMGGHHRISDPRCGCRIAESHCAVNDLAHLNKQIV